MIATVSKEAVNQRYYQGKDEAAFTRTLTGLIKDARIDEKAAKRIKKLRRTDWKFASDVLAEAAADAAKKGLFCINDNVTRMAQQTLVEHYRKHGGLPSKYKRAKGHDDCNRGDFVFQVENADGEEEAWSIADSVLPELNLSLEPRLDQLKKDGSGEFETLNPARAGADALHDIDPARLSKHALTQLLVATSHVVESQEELNRIMADEDEELLAKSEATGKKKAVHSTLDTALSAIDPVATAEIQDQQELNRAASGEDKRRELRTVRNAISSHRLHRSGIDRAIAHFDRLDRQFKSVTNAVQKWKRQKERLHTAFLSNCLKPKPDSFERYMRPVRSTNKVVLDHYAQRGAESDYAAFRPDHICADGRAAGAHWLAEYAGRDDVSEDAFALEMLCVITADEESAWNKMQPAWRRAHDIEAQERVQ